MNHVNTSFASLLTGYLCLFPIPVSAWIFGATSDIHSNDAVYGPAPTAVVNRDHRQLLDFHDSGAQFIIQTGDLFEGIWLSNQNTRSTYGILPNGTFSLPYFIDNCAQVCYGDIKRRLEDPPAGLPLISAPGDHELGDNNWPSGSEKARAMIYFKQAFAKAFTLNSDGSSRYDGWIGAVRQRPVGTPYANTSYAFIKNNILFVVLDVFRFEGESQVLDPRTGVASPELVGDHLNWLDAVLAAGRNLSDIRFIVVAGHTPAILPINLIDTSAMIIKGAERSSLWQVIRKHKVDVYLTGEVHSLTPSVDESSGTVQLVNGFKGYSHSHLLFDVTENRIDIQLREHSDTTYTTFETTGTMTITKSADNGNNVITGTGNLKPVDRAGIVLNYNMDGTDYSSNIPNNGQLSEYYYGLAKNVTSTGGIIGNAGRFSGASPSYIELPVAKAPVHLNPIISDHPRSLACWINTNAAGRQTLISLGAGSSAFALQMNNGTPSLVAHGSTVKPTAVLPTLSDGLWHHVATTHPGHGATMMAAKLYVDGVALAVSASNSATKLDTLPWGGITVGADGQKANGFSGSLDDCGVWSSALSEGMISALHRSGRDPGIGFAAATLDRIFTVYRTGRAAEVDGAHWSPAAGLTGSAGTITKEPSGDFTIVLGPDGSGVTTVTHDGPPPNRLTNPGFENDFAGWQGIGNGTITGANVHSGQKAALYTRPVATKTMLYQSQGALPPGAYTLSIWYQRLNGIKWAHLGVKVRDTATGKVTYQNTVPMSSIGGWTEAVLGSVPVTTGQTLQFNIWMEINAGGTLYLDDAQLR
ncbi:LamG-like jellyroll fold domain-containing protein [Methylotetracoccus oryzae]|uniref:LamG-like jellyroll fold domain-containing protein n=1 Tax=Methylotetracoccus oryzae TaxID=1919059 RepID=UPI00111A56FF|nr:LamG-like jellyroll fold domain-containing protein [Methylotetracoccus oryzae]